MIELKNVQIQRGGRILIDNATFSLHAKQCMALTGVNGCGKSTLFQVLLGSHGIDQGDLQIQPQCRIAHMAQEIEHINRTAREHVLDGFTLFRQLEQKKTEAEAAGDDNKLAHALAALDEIDAYSLANRAETILLGLGFSNTDYDKAVSDFSGGWRIRLNLARTLFSPSDLLLLDEPTNHLDIEAIHFLELWISKYEGAVLLVSHDRDFIDACCNRLAHIEQTVFTVYSGNYSSFERQRAEHMQQQQGLLVKQQRRQKELQGFIDRFRAQATKAKQAQSRIKALEKMQTIQVVREQSPYQFKIPCSDKVSSPLISWSKVDVGYQGNAIVKQCNFSINPGQRFGLLGTNGAGKSTVIKSLAQSQAILAGDESFGEHLRIGYFAQHQLEALDLDASAILHIQRMSPMAREQEIRDFLGSFNIRGDQATDVIRPFSGGEKARLALAIVAWEKPNVLLLDEPTNHLDIAMREALSDAIQAYEGAVILISHDRYMLRHCVDDFFLVEDGALTLFDGDIDDYYAMREAKDGGNNKTVNADGKIGTKKQARADAASIRKQLAPLKKRVDNFEKTIDKLDSLLGEAREALSDPGLYEENNKKQLQTSLEAEKNTAQKLQEAEESWEQALEEYETLQQTLEG